MRLAIVLLVALGGMLSGGGSAPKAKPVPLAVNQQADEETERRSYAEVCAMHADGTSPRLLVAIGGSARDLAEASRATQG